MAQPLLGYGVIDKVIGVGLAWAVVVVDRGRFAGVGVDAVPVEGAAGAGGEALGDVGATRVVMAAVFPERRGTSFDHSPEEVDPAVVGGAEVVVEESAAPELKPSFTPPRDPAPEPPVAAMPGGGACEDITSKARRTATPAIPQVRMIHFGSRARCLSSLACC